MATLIFWNIDKPKEQLPAVCNLDDLEGYRYTFAREIPEWKKEHAALVIGCYKRIDLFGALSDICGFSVTSAASLYNYGMDEGGYRVRLPDGGYKDIRNEELEPYRIGHEEDTYVYTQEIVSETSSWYYDYRFPDGPLTEDVLTSAMIAVVKFENESHGSVGDILFALTKALEAVRDGQTVFADVD